jgi:predicted HAD superfamily Cof-like phosphohydrolase
MKNIFDMQSEFMEKAGQNIKGELITQADLYVDLVIEEFNEFYDVENHNRETIKECCDILVVVSGYLISLLGTEKAKKAYKLVHESNMAKLNGKIEKRDDGKVLKSDEWKREVKEKLMSDLANLIK